MRWVSCALVQNDLICSSTCSVRMRRIPGRWTTWTGYIAIETRFQVQMRIVAPTQGDTWLSRASRGCGVTILPIGQLFVFAVGSTVGLALHKSSSVYGSANCVARCSIDKLVNCNKTLSQETTERRSGGSAGEEDRVRAGEGHRCR